MNPWLAIPLADYEAHMSAPEVAQARLLADMLSLEINARGPKAVALPGCAGGNGLERIPVGSKIRVFAADINPEYIAAAKRRFARKLPNAHFAVHDIEAGPMSCPPLDLVFAGLLFEYLDIEKTLSNIRQMLEDDGLLVAVLQLPSAGKAAVTPTRYRSLSALEGFMRLVPPNELTESAGKLGLQLESSETRRSPAGKRFELMRFRKER